MGYPVAVIISDVHYNLTNLELADKAMRLAINKANVLEVPLIVAGDLHDTKANLRGECVNAMIETFGIYSRGVQIIIISGNHDRINEKSEIHSLNFLKAYQLVIDKPTKILGLHLIPYQSDIDDLKRYINKIDTGSIIVMHQGLVGSNMGD